MTGTRRPKTGTVSLVAALLLLAPPVAGLVHAQRGRGSIRGAGRSVHPEARRARPENRRPEQNAAREDRQSRRDGDREDRHSRRSDAREDSQAARDDRDRRHAHGFRRHGTVVAALPTGHTTVVVGGTSYHYHGGLYYRPHAGGFVVVSAPVGAAVVTLPAGYATLYVTGSPYYYWYGTYYVWDPVLGRYVVVRAPMGATLTALPDGHTVVYVAGRRYYVYDGIHYRPYYRNGALVYVVVEI